jgi:hypothetical protein
MRGEIRPPSIFPWGEVEGFDARRDPTAVDHALALRGRESGLEQVEQHVDRESVRPHHRLGATLPARGEQFEGAAAEDWGGGSGMSFASVRDHD